MSIPREHRLRKHAEFEAVYRGGRRHFSNVLTAFYLLREAGESGRKTDAIPPEEINGVRVGITVGRALGTSTARNRIKRRTREAVRANIARVTRPVDVVINPKKSVLEADFSVLCSEVARAFDAIEQKAAPASRDAREDAGGDMRHARPERKVRAARKT